MINPAQDQFESTRVYTDFNALAQLKSKGRDDNPAAIREAVQQFESIFVRMMLKSMRDANAAIIDKPLFDSDQMDLYNDMHDDQLALHLSGPNSGLGLTNVLVQQLTGNPATSSKKSTTEMPFKPQIIIKPQPLSVIKVPGSEMVPGKVEVPGSEKVAAEVAIVKHEERGLDFSSPHSFVQSLWPYAEKAAKLLELDPKVLIAQAALETGWGQHVMRTEQGTSSKNLFGIKANKDWGGERVQVNTLELEGGTLNKQKAEFRAYDSYADSFTDYAQFINGKSRYQKALNVATEPENYAKELQSAGYATDPDYGEKIASIYHSPIMRDAIKFLVDKF